MSLGSLWFKMAGKMKVLIKETERAGYEYKEMPIPEPCEGELLVKVLVSSICGSDISLYKWNEGVLCPCTRYPRTFSLNVF
jgi:D-arabinose 1-dehydrogenase-like Zn-dependent alcohol dehydrogenase